MEQASNYNNVRVQSSQVVTKGSMQVKNDFTEEWFSYD